MIPQQWKKILCSIEINYVHRTESVCGFRLNFIEKTFADGAIRTRL